MPEACEMYLSAIEDDETESSRIEFATFLLQIDCPTAAVEQLTKVLDESRRTNNHRLRSVACNNLAIAFSPARLL